MTNNPNITISGIGIRRVRVTQLVSRVLDITVCDRNPIAINSSNFIPDVAGISVDVVRAVDAVEGITLRARVGDNIPCNPGTIADGADSGAGVRSEEVGNLARVSNVELIILTEGREIK